MISSGPPSLTEALHGEEGRDWPDGSVRYFDPSAWKWAQPRKLPNIVPDGRFL